MKFNPIRNVKTSAVFFRLVMGDSYPTIMATSLRVTKGAVAQQLNRLRKIGLVKREEKIKKTQIYGINRETLVDLFLSHAFRLQRGLSIIEKREEIGELLKGKEREVVLLVPEGERETWQSFKKEFVKDETLQSLIINYLKVYIQELKEENLTLLDVIRGFENALIKNFSKVKKTLENEKTLSLLEKWVRLARFAEPMSEFAFEEALKMNISV